MLKYDHPLIIRLHAMGYKLSLQQYLRKGGSIVTVGAKRKGEMYLSATSKTGDTAAALGELMEKITSSAVENA